MTRWTTLGGRRPAVLLTALVTGWLGVMLMDPAAGEAAPAAATPSIGDRYSRQCDRICLTGQSTVRLDAVNGGR